MYWKTRIIICCKGNVGISMLYQAAQQLLYNNGKFCKDLVKNSNTMSMFHLYSRLLFFLSKSFHSFISEARSARSPTKALVEFGQRENHKKYFETTNFAPKKIRFLPGEIHTSLSLLTSSFFKHCFYSLLFLA